MPLVLSLKSLELVSTECTQCLVCCFIHRQLNYDGICNSFSFAVFIAVSIYVKFPLISLVQVQTD